VDTRGEHAAYSARTNSARKCLPEGGLHSSRKWEPKVEAGDFAMCRAALVVLVEIQLVFNFNFKSPMTE
jgi:hypothetical protein